MSLCEADRPYLSCLIEAYLMPTCLQRRKSEEPSMSERSSTKQSMLIQTLRFFLLRRDINRSLHRLR